MNSPMKSLIQKLVETPGPPGHEAQVRQVIRAEVEPLADEARIDALGNLLVRKGSRQANGRRIMLAAHMDEIGLIASHVDERGFVRFTTLGALSPHTLPGNRVRFMNGTIGVIGAERREQPEELPSFEKMFIDVGAASREDCPIKIGDAAAFERPFLDLGDRLVAKAMDNRAGVAVMIEVLRRLESTPHEVYFVFSVQEEVGRRGATVAAFGLDADIGLAVDVTAAGDTPNGLKREISLGKGPAITLRDGGLLADRRVVNWMRRTAETMGLAYQLEVIALGGTDSHAIQVTRAGVPSGSLLLPCRYIHSPSEMVACRDMEDATRLLAALFSAPVELE